MIELLYKKRPAREALKSRRQEVERCLSTYGVLRQAGGRLRRPRIADREETQSCRLRKALEHLGPVFASFGIYMASRVDFLLAHDRLELAAIADVAEATPITAVRQLIAREIGRPREEVFPFFEDEPFESRLLFQSHRARLNDGKAVTVKVLHPELQEYLECDLELLPILEHAFPGTVRRGAAIKDAIADFRRTLQWQSDLLHTVKSFEMLARDAQEFEMLKIPTVYTDLSSSQLITTEQVYGVTLEKMMAAFESTGATRDTRTQTVFGEGDMEPHTLARRLCMVWLRQALLGERFPVELRPVDIMVLPSKQIALTDGVFASLPSDAKKHLWHYVIATSTEDPDKACTYVLREIMREGRPIDEDELRYRFREVVPFRDGGWSGSGDSTRLIEYLFVHWKLVSDRGLRPQPHLLCFYRGLFQTLALVRPLAPDNDPLREGLQDVRTIAMLTQFQEMMALRQLSTNVDKYTTMMMELPQKFDNALTLATESSTRLKFHGTKFTTQARQRNSSAVVIALLFVLGGIVLLSHHLAAAAIGEKWVDKISAVAFVLIGALLLRAVSRPP